MNNLPKVTAFEIKEKLNNSQERFYGSNDYINNEKPRNIMSKINDIFSDSNYVYKSNVRITLKDDTKDEVIIGRTKDELLTIKGDKIKIDNIIDIKKM